MSEVKKKVLKTPKSDKVVSKNVPSIITSKGTISKAEVKESIKKESKEGVKGTVRAGKILKSKFVDTGSIGINKCLGGGLPEGKISEWCSKSGLGKSTIACYVSRVVCAEGKQVLYLDSEFGLTDELLEGVGLTPYKGKSFFAYQIRTFSDIEDKMDRFLRLEEPPKLIVIDSISSMVSSKLANGKMKIEDVEIGWQSRLMSLFFLKYKGILPKTRTHLMLINQQRYKINLFGPSYLGSAGGNPIEFFCDIRLKITKKEDIKRGNNVIGVDAFIEAIKNRFALSFIKYFVCIIFGQGVSNLRACTYILEKEKYVKKSGSYYIVQFGESSETFFGRNKLEDYLRENQSKVTTILRKKGYL